MVLKPNTGSKTLNLNLMPQTRPQAEEGADRAEEGAVGPPAVRREAPPGGGRHHGQRQRSAHSQVRLY